MRRVVRASRSRKPTLRAHGPPRGGRIMRCCIKALLGCWTVGGCLALLSTCWAQALFPVVKAAEQADRDRVRIGILQDELLLELAAVETAAKRRGERLAALDREGAHEAEDALAQHITNVGLLRRELIETRGALPAGAA